MSFYETRHRVKNKSVPRVRSVSRDVPIKQARFSIFTAHPRQTWSYTSVLERARNWTGNLFKFFFLCCENSTSFQLPLVLACLKHEPFRKRVMKEASWCTSIVQSREKHSAQKHVRTRVLASFLNVFVFSLFLRSFCHQWTVLPNSGRIRAIIKFNLIIGFECHVKCIALLILNEQHLFKSAEGCLTQELYFKPVSLLANNVCPKPESLGKLSFSRKRRRTTKLVAVLYWVACHITGRKCLTERT